MRGVTLRNGRQTGDKNPVRILVLADLHHDFWEACNRDPFEGLHDTLSALDHLVLAGDLTNKPKIRWKYALEQVLRHVPGDKISVFPGNHDFYDFRLDGEERLADVANSFGVRYAQKKVLLLGDVRLLCATLWTDFELGRGRAFNEALIPTRLNDYRRIRVASDGYRRVRPADVVRIHVDHLAWLKAELAKPFQGRTMVATHHAPHPDVLAAYADGLDAAYASNLEGLILHHSPEIWFFGHCHDAHSIKVGSTRLVNASLGYPDEVTDPAERIRSLVLEV